MGLLGSIIRVCGCFLVEQLPWRCDDFLRTSVDHCVQLVGYGDSGSSYWKVRNSWGASWGESGHVRLQIGSNLCAINSSPTKVSATTVGPSPSPSPSPTPTPSPSPGQCHAISAVVTDDWCVANCAAGFCPSDLCQ